MKVQQIICYRQTLLDEVNALLPQLSGSAAPLSEPDLRAIIASDTSHLLTASEDGRLCGMLTLVVFRIPTGVRAWVEDVVVNQEDRGKGVGQTLLEHAIELAKSLGAKNPRLNVAALTRSGKQTVSEGRLCQETDQHIKTEIMTSRFDDDRRSGNSSGMTFGKGAELVIRGAREADRESRQAIVEAATRELRQVYRLRERRGGSHAPPTGTLVALSAGVLVGTAEYVIGDDELYIQGVAVHPRHRAGGVCRALLRELEMLAQKYRIAVLSLRVIEETGNTAIFERFGFKVTRRAVSSSYVGPDGGAVTQVEMERIVT